jgi:hypothetical protein
MSTEPTLEDLSARLVRFVAAGTVAAARLASERGLPIEYHHVQQALEEVLVIARSEHLLREGLCEERIIELLRDYPFARLFPVVLREVILHEPAIPSDVVRRLEERTVKSAGEVWRVHKNDADPFPSNPHAHNLESGLKLHLGTGELFLKRQPAGKIGRRGLLAIRAKLEGVTLPKLTE